MLKDRPELSKLDYSKTYNLKKGNTYTDDFIKTKSKIRRIAGGFDKLKKMSEGTYKTYVPKKTVYMTKRRKAEMSAKKKDKENFLKFASLIGLKEAKKEYYVTKAGLRSIENIRKKVMEGKYELESYDTERKKNKTIVSVKIKGGSRPFKFTVYDA